MKVYSKNKPQEITPLSPEVRHKDDVVRLASVADVVIGRTHQIRKPERPPARQLKLKFDNEPP